MTPRTQRKIIGVMIIVAAYFTFCTAQGYYAKEIITGFENFLYSLVIFICIFFGCMMAVK